MEKKRFNFPPQGIISRADFAQIGSSLAFFALKRPVIQLLDFLPTIRPHFHSPRPSPFPAPTRPLQASNHAGQCREKLSALRRFPRRSNLRKSATLQPCTSEDRLRLES